MGNIDLAEEKIYRSFKVASQNENKEALNDMYLSLSVLDSAKGNYKSAQKNYKLYTVNKKISDDRASDLRSESFKIRSRYIKKEQD